LLCPLGLSIRYDMYFSRDWTFLSSVHVVLNAEAQNLVASML